jgi:hypothetical protein
VKPEEFNPHSIPVMLATLIEKMEQSKRDRETDKEERATFRLEIKEELSAIKEQTTKTNGRVTKLERLWESVVVRVATVTAIVGGIGGIISWAVSLGLHRLFLGP